MSTIEVTSPFEYEVCSQWSPTTENVCEVYTMSKQQITYTPTFVYNYECSSDVLQAYVPVFLISARWDGFIVPISILTVRLLVYRWFGGKNIINDDEDDDYRVGFFDTTVGRKSDRGNENSHNEQQSRTQIIRWVLLLVFVPRMLWSVEEEREYHIYRHSYDKSSVLSWVTSVFTRFDMPDNGIELRASSSKSEADVSADVENDDFAPDMKGKPNLKQDSESETNTNQKGQKGPDKSFRTKQWPRRMIYVDGSSVLANSIGTLAILVTFGIVAPFLAIAVTIQLVAPIIVEETLLGRLLYKEIRRGNTAKDLDFGGDKQEQNLDNENMGANNNRRSSGVRFQLPTVVKSGPEGERDLGASQHRLLMREHDPSNRLLSLEEDCIFSGTAEFVSGRWIIMICSVVFLSSVLFDTAGNRLGWEKAIVYPILLGISAIFISIDVAVFVRCNWLPKWLMASSDEDEQQKEFRSTIDDGGLVSLAALGTAAKDVFFFENEDQHGSTNNELSGGMGSVGESSNPIHTHRVRDSL